MQRQCHCAWQSQETGDEQCDLYVFTNPLTGQKIRSYFADEQIHISADVAYAFWEAGEIVVRSYGDVAVLRYPAEIAFTVDGARTPRRRLWHTDLYERHGGRWQVVWSQATEIRG